MACYIKTLKNNGDDIAPRTKTSAVTNEDGENLDSILGQCVTVANGDTISNGTLADGSSAGGGIVRVELHLDPETGLLEKTPEEIYNDYWENGIEYWFYDETTDANFIITGKKLHMVIDGEPSSTLVVIFKADTVWMEISGGFYTCDTVEELRIYDGVHSLFRSDEDSYPESICIENVIEAETGEDVYTKRRVYGPSDLFTPHSSGPM